MRVQIEADYCIASGHCVQTCPEVFDQDDAGTVVLRLTEVPPALEEQVREAVAGCPGSVITIDEGA
jgi:ferredoxin